MCVRMCLSGHTRIHRCPLGVKHLGDPLAYAAVGHGVGEGLKHMPSMVG